MRVVEVYMNKNKKTIVGRMRKIGGRTARPFIVLVALGLPLAVPEVSAQQIQQQNQTFVSQVLRGKGQAIIPTYEGWFLNQDGTSTLCYGYFNLNTEESLEIPHGELNRLLGYRTPFEVFFGKTVRYTKPPLGVALRT